MSVVRKDYYIGEFKTSPIRDSYLDTVRNDFAAVRAAGLKILVRFMYAWVAELDPRDASKNQILAHLDQLKPLFVENSDVLLALEAGFVGLYGQWNRSTNFNADPKTDFFNGNSVEIMNKLFEVVPSNRMVLFCYANNKPSQWSTPLTFDEAFTGSAKARFGLTDDGILDDYSDCGFFADKEAPRLKEQAYLEADTRYSFMSGEPIGRPPSLVNPLSYLAMYHYTTVNMSATCPEFYEYWKKNGYYNQVMRKLGYRFRLIEATLPVKTSLKGKNISMNFKITNDGWASPRNERKVEIILRNQKTGIKYTIPVTDDPRFWFPDSTCTIQVNSTLPMDITPGKYDIILNLPDPAPSLHDRPEYSIHLANKDLWEAKTGYNILYNGLEVSKK